MQRKAFLNTSYSFHQLINQALLGFTSQTKSEEATGCSGHAKQLIHLGGSPASFFFRSRLLMSH